MFGNVAWLTVWLLGTLAVNAQTASPVMDSLPGEPGKDYPIYSEIPKTSFSCQKQPFPGYYADVDAGCQAYHLCEDGENQTSYLCPNGTIFNQSTQSCEEWSKVDCKLSPQLFWLNKYFYEKSKSENSASKDDSRVGDDGNTDGLLKGNNSSENNDNFNLQEIQDLIDSEITKVLERKQSEGRSLNSSLDVETSFQKLRKAMDNGNSSQFKESLDAIISSRVEAMRDNYRSLIYGEQLKEMDSQRKAKTAEKIFTLLSYVDQIKTTLTEAKSSKSGSSMDKMKSEIMPHFGEKLYKMLNTLEKNQAMSNNSQNNNNSNSHVNIANDLDFLDNYKHFINADEINKDKHGNGNTNSRKEKEYLNFIGNIPHSINESTFNKDLNTSTNAKLNLLSNEASIEMIQRLLDIAKKNIPSPTDVSKSIETSQVEETPDNNASHKVDDSTRNDSYHKSIYDIIKSYEISENKSGSNNSGINNTNEINKGSITSYNRGEIITPKYNYLDHLNDMYYYDDYNDEYDTDDVPNKINMSGRNENNVDSIHGNAKNLDAFGENVKNSTQPNDENVSLVEDLQQNMTNIEHEESLHKHDSLGRDLIGGERKGDNLNQNSSSVQNVSNDENINKTHSFYENLIRVLNSQGNVNHNVVFGENSTHNENDTNTDASVEMKENSLVDKKENNDSDSNPNNSTDENNSSSSDSSEVDDKEDISAGTNSSSDASEVDDKEDLSANTDMSEENISDIKTVMTDDNEADKHHDELIGILKGIYSSIEK